LELVVLAFNNHHPRVQLRYLPADHSSHIGSRPAWSLSPPCSPYPPSSLSSSPSPSRPKRTTSLYLAKAKKTTRSSRLSVRHRQNRKRASRAWADRAAKMSGEVEKSKRVPATGADVVCRSRPAPHGGEVSRHAEGIVFKVGRKIWSSRHSKHPRMMPQRKRLVFPKKEESLIRQPPTPNPARESMKPYVSSSRGTPWP